MLHGDVARLLAVLEAQHLARHHDVVVDVLADRLGVLDLLLVGLDQRRERLGRAHGEAEHAEAHARRLLERAGLPAATHIGGCGSL